MEDEFSRKEKLQRAKEIIQTSNDYFVDTAIEGSEWEFVNYAYLPTTLCEWCLEKRDTERPIKHVYFIRNKETDEVKGVGSVCIKNIEDWGRAYKEFENFRKKIDILSDMKDVDKRDLQNIEDLEKLGVEEKFLTLSNLDKEIERHKEERKKRLREKEKERLKEQTKVIKEEDLHKIENWNAFTKDVFSQFRNMNSLSEGQLKGLRNTKDFMIENYGSIEEAMQKKEEYKEVVGAMGVLLKDYNVWEKHREVLRDMKHYYLQNDYLSDKQLDYAKNIISHYSKKLDDDPRYQIEDDEFIGFGLEECPNCGSPNVEFSMDIWEFGCEDCGYWL